MRGVSTAVHSSHYFRPLRRTANLILDERGGGMLAVQGGAPADDRRLPNPAWSLADQSIRGIAAIPRGCSGRPWVSDEGGWRRFERRALSGVTRGEPGQAVRFGRAEPVMSRCAIKAAAGPRYGWCLDGQGWREALARLRGTTPATPQRLGAHPR